MALAKGSPVKDFLSGLGEGKRSDAAIIAAGLASRHLARAPVRRLHALRVRIGRSPVGCRTPI